MGKKKRFFGKKKTDTAKKASVDDIRKRGESAVAQVTAFVKDAAEVIDVKFAKDPDKDEKYYVVIRIQPETKLSVTVPSAVDGFEVMIQEIKDKQDTPAHLSDKSLTITEASARLKEILGESEARIEPGFGVLTVVSNEQHLDLPGKVGKFEVREKREAPENGPGEETPEEPAEDGSEVAGDSGETELAEEVDEPREEVRRDDEPAKDSLAEDDSVVADDTGSQISDDVVKALRAEAEEKLAFARSEADKAESLKALNDAQREDIQNQVAAAEEMKASARQMEDDARDGLRDIERIKKEISSSHEKSALDQAQLEIEKVKAKDFTDRAQRKEAEAEEKLSESKKLRREAEAEREAIEKKETSVTETERELRRREAQILAKESDIDDLHAKAREDRRVSSETLRSLKGHRIDSERLADVAENHMKDMERSRGEAALKVKELDLKIAEQTETSKRAARTLTLNEAEASMLTEYKKRIEDKENAADEKLSDAEIISTKADLQTSDLRKDLEEAEEMVLKAESERDAAVRLAESLRPEVEKASLLIKEVDELRSQLDSRGPAEVDEETVEKSKRISRSLADAIRASSDVMNNPEKKARCQDTLKELVKVCEGVPASRVLFDSAEALVDEIK